MKILKDGKEIVKNVKERGEIHRRGHETVFDY